MTKKDFILIAQALLDAKPADDALPQTKLNHYRCCRKVADACTKTNSAFNRARFLAACGVDP